MTSKLTLSMDKQLIEKAKEYARQSNRSLSELISSYLEKITDSELDELDSELSQIVGVINLPADFDDKAEIRKMLNQRHD